MRPLIFGEVLFDRFSDGTSILGGAPFNVAWHLKGFGLDPLLISRTGDDAPGREIAEAMAEWSMDGRGVQIDPNRPTGVVEVTTCAGRHSFNIPPDQAYDFVDSDLASEVSLTGGVGFVYHGTLALRNARSREALEAVLEAATNAPIFLDVNLRDPWWHAVNLPEACTRARWLKLNEDELDRISQSFEMPSRRFEEQAAALQDRFGLELIVVTRGAQGASARLSSGAAHTVRPEESIDVVDTVGAGDAFTAVLLHGLISDWPLPTTLHHAQAFASAICGVRGATVRDRGFYALHTQRWGAA